MNKYVNIQKNKKTHTQLCFVLCNLLFNKRIENIICNDNVVGRD